MPHENFIKNITSKDINLSKNTIRNMIKSASIADFKELCEKSGFIFPFLKERITNDFVKLINKDDLKTVFEFAKIYNCDFENLIVKSWLKFASQDLTDDILDLFETGTDEQKTYAALYFKYIQDPLALEYLNNLAHSGNDFLVIAAAQTLSAFGDTDTYEDMKNIALSSSDDFEKTSAFSFISAYQGQDAVDFIVNNYSKSPFKVNIIASLLDYNDFDKLKNLPQDSLIRVFSTLIEGYPDDISLDTVGYYRIIDFIKQINQYNIQYAKNALIVARERFKEFFENDIYSFDLDKNSKNDLKDVYNLLKSLTLDYDNLQDELKKYNSHNFELALNVIEELKLENFAQNVINSLNFSDEEHIAHAALCLKTINQGNLIPKEIIDRIQNENIKALVQSCV